MDYTAAFVGAFSRVCSHFREKGSSSDDYCDVNPSITFFFCGHGGWLASAIPLRSLDPHPLYFPNIPVHADVLARSNFPSFHIPISLADLLILLVATSGSFSVMATIISGSVLL